MSFNIEFQHPNGNVQEETRQPTVVVNSDIKASAHHTIHIE